MQSPAIEAARIAVNRYRVVLLLAALYEGLLGLAFLFFSGPIFRVLGIELDCAFETFDRLTQTFRCASRGIVTSGSVELARFFVFSGLRFRRRHQYLPRYRRDV